MSQPDNKSARKVIVFNKKGEYIGIVSSISKAALLQDVKKKIIYDNCIGKSVMVGDFYFRFYHPELDLSLCDLETITVLKYDEMYREATN